MYKLMIVDDENLIRDGLRTVIEWEDLGIEISGEAANGKQALALIEYMAPDIILTDIKMPECDGLKLLQEIRTHYQNIKVAVLSGFDDFSYVRDAMRLGAVNYLLKPVDTDELISAMREIIDTIKNNLKLSLERKEYLDFLRINTLNRIVKNDISPKEFREKCDFLGLSFNSRQMYICLISISVESGNRWELFAAIDACMDIVDQPEMCYIFADDHNYVVFLFKDATVSVINSFLAACLGRLSGLLGNQNLASIGEPATSHRSLVKSYDSAIRLLNYQLIYGTGKVFSFEQYETSSETRPAIFSRFAESIETWDKEAVNDNIDQLFQELSTGAYSLAPDTVKYYIIDVMSFVLYRLLSLNISPEFIQKLKNDLYERLMHISTQDKLKTLLQDFSNSIISQLFENYTNKYSHNVRAVVDYINDKYDDINISLKTMAYRLNVNAAYLGRVFKSETNQYFSDYLNQKRVCEANVLLRNSHLKAN